MSGKYANVRKAQREMREDDSKPCETWTRMINASKALMNAAPDGFTVGCIEAMVSTGAVAYVHGVNAGKLHLNDMLPTISEDWENGKQVERVIYPQLHDLAFVAVRKNYEEIGRQAMLLADDLANGDCIKARQAELEKLRKRHKDIERFRIAVMHHYRTLPGYPLSYEVAEERGLV